MPPYKDKKPKTRNQITAKMTPMERLGEKKQKYVEGRIAGDTIAVSAAAAGVSRRMGAKYEKDEDVRIAYKQLMRRACPQKKLVELIVGGATATMPIYDANGKKKGKRPDWRTRKSYIDMIREDGGYSDSKANQNATMISVTVQHVGAGSIERENGPGTDTVIEASTEAIVTQ